LRRRVDERYCLTSTVLTSTALPVLIAVQAALLTLSTLFTLTLLATTLATTLLTALAALATLLLTCCC
jgi:hypothetical protein